MLVCAGVPSARADNLGVTVECRDGVRCRQVMQDSFEWRQFVRLRRSFVGLANSPAGVAAAGQQAPMTPYASWLLFWRWYELACTIVFEIP